MMHLKHLIRQCATLSPGGTASQVADNSHVTSLLSAASELIEGFHNSELLLTGLEKMVTQVMSSVSVVDAHSGHVFCVCNRCSLRSCLFCDCNRCSLRSCLLCL